MTIFFSPVVEEEQEEEQYERVHPRHRPVQEGEDLAHGAAGGPLVHVHGLHATCDYFFEKKVLLLHCSRKLVLTQAHVKKNV